jgi:hypothetical protein
LVTSQEDAPLTTENNVDEAFGEATCGAGAEASGGGGGDGDNEPPVGTDGAPGQGVAAADKHEEMAGVE